MAVVGEKPMAIDTADAARPLRTERAASGDLICPEGDTPGGVLRFTLKTRAREAACRIDRLPTYASTEQSREWRIPGIRWVFQLRGAGWSVMRPWAYAPSAKLLPAS